MKQSILLGFFAGIIGNAFSQWSANSAINTSICIQANDQQDARIVTDGKSGAIITWLDFRNDAAQLAGDIYIQRIDKNGINKWSAQGVALCTDATNQTAPSVVEDGSGGAIVVWNDWRNGNRDIYVQKIDSNGAVQWATNGVAVVAKANHQQDAKLISDGVGGAIIVWQDSLNGLWDIYAQRISSTGSLSWAPAGISVCSSVEAQINPRIETDAAGGAIIVWQDKRNGVDYDIYAQRIDNTGATIWTSGGVVVCNSISTQSNPKIEPDGAGGVIIAWQDKRNGADYNIYAQRFNSAGIIQWTVNGVAVCSAAASQSALDMTSEGISGAIIAWKDQRNGNFDIYAQKINLTGAVQWTANGIGISTALVSQLNPNAVGDGAGGAILVWQDSSATNSDINSQRIDANGNIQWTAGGVLVATATDNQTSPKSVSDGNGGCIYTWQDKRNTTDQDIYAHHIYANGSAVNGIHENNSMLISANFPNPFTANSVIEVYAGLSGGLKDDFDLLVFDMLGQKVEIPFIVSENKINISRGELKNGMYFYEVILSNRVVSKGKLILID